MGSLKKLFVLGIMILVIGAMTVSARPQERVGSIDDECARQGFEFGIVKFEYDEELGFVAEDPAIYPWVIEVEGDDYEARWTSQPEVYAILSKEGQSTYTWDGGLNGTIHPSGQQSISHLTFCGDSEPVPEFGVIASIALALGLLGMVVYKRN